MVNLYHSTFKRLCLAQLNDAVEVFALAANDIHQRIEVISYEK